MQIHDVMFIIARETSSFFHMLDEDIAALTLTHYLYEIGVKDIVVFPEKEEDKYIADVEQAFERFLAEHAAKLYCISCWTSTYAVAMDFAKKIKANKPDAVIIAGGPHFFSVDEIKNTLENEDVDAVFRGGGEPFLRFASAMLVDGTVNILKENGRNAFYGNLPSKGMYVLKDGILSGNGKGTFPYPVIPMVSVSGENIEIRTMFNDSCPNGCDYCVIEHAKTDRKYTPVLGKMIKKSVEEIKEQLPSEIILSLSDSAPFSRINRQNTEAFMKNVYSHAGFGGMNVFVDPADLDEDFYRLVEQFNINTFFIGRDRVIEDSFTGRRLYRLLRSTAELDDEYRILKDFIFFLKDRKTECKQEVFLGYILSPYEDELGSQKMINEIIDFTVQCSDIKNVRVQSNMFLLNPYPGTRVAQRAEGEFIPMRYFYYPYPNTWTGVNTVNIYLEIVRLIIAKMFCNNGNISFYKPMLQLAHDLQYKRSFDYGLLDDIDSKNLKRFAIMLTDKILSLNLGDEKFLDDYLGNILSLHYIGCMLSIVLFRPEYAERKGLYEKIIREDGVAEFLKRDLSMIKKYAQKNKETFYGRYDF
ncbi:hypothetical protein EP073_11510 [Geovibrio thiophilus]|uniref:B12-binding domain-containing protein n=1 Tax=Geovibrio thiophilus TaxID=139438 RepID=A0A410K168_9BACT|nr:hypothetical protein [Geovibrio thiophilus]QAR34008.1 hypothetical protein EP073_11510 [Geovibrio thiophilus]